MNLFTNKPLQKSDLLFMLELYEEFLTNLKREEIEFEVKKQLAFIEKMNRYRLELKKKDFDTETSPCETLSDVAEVVTAG